MFGRDPTYFLNVFPPPNARYTVARVAVPASGAPVQDVKVELRRGVLVRGRVTEAGSGEPVAGARVQYNDSDSEQISGAIEPSRLNTAISGPDGRFELPVFPEPGHLLILGPTPDYVAVESSYGVLRLYADAVVPLGPGPEGGERSLEVRLRRGVTLRGRVLGPDDKPAGSLLLFSLSYRVSGYWYFSNSTDLLQCANGQFELPGCDPDRTHTAYLFDPARRLGATVELSRANADEPATVRLLPCGSARGQFVDANGKPRANYRPWFVYLLKDGAPQRVDLPGATGERPLQAVYGNPYYLDPATFGKTGADGDGRFTFPALIPEAKYMIWWPRKDLADPRPMPRLDFTVGPGEAKDLGKVVIDYTLSDR
jgi:hypothetical protein